MRRTLSRSTIGLAGTALALGARVSLSAAQAAYGHIPPPSAHSLPQGSTVRRAHRPAPNNGRDIVFAAKYYRKSGRFFSEDAARAGKSPFVPHGAPDRETLEAVSDHLYVVRPDGTGLRRLTFGNLHCEEPRWSPDGAKIVFVGSTKESHRHLYMVNPDGSHCVRITFGPWEDTGPQWLPDSSSLLFTRHAPDDCDCPGTHTPMPPSVCIVAARSGQGKSPGDVHTIRRLPDNLEGFYQSCFSPDGRWLALQTGGGYTKTPAKFLLIDPASGVVVRQVAHVEGFCWSPDSQKLYLNGSDKQDRILTVATGAISAVAVHFRHSPYWMNNDRLVALNNHDGILSLLDSAGKQLVSHDLVPGRSLEHFSDPEEEKYESRQIVDDEELDWFLPPRNDSRKPWGLVCASTHISDGPHYACYRIDLETGVFRLVRTGDCFGLSPDGTRCLTADYDWVGPYKRGGERVGPLEIVDVRTGKARPLSRKLAVIGDADWRGAREPK